ncbi:hypothetical protein BpHYR1_005993 [Brachionus plicatilis]|uniref:Uncharacterized protein n=1 Tax=Brachionus plicatilis TaxID=10195 RepID=A0A3M7SWJ5_BRAPC|nr:hypothetical protein BpHYR1_005993 [Brachionus plicatilis]
MIATGRNSVHRSDGNVASQLVDANGRHGTVVSAQLAHIAPSIYVPHNARLVPRASDQHVVTVGHSHAGHSVHVAVQSSFERHLFCFGPVHLPHIDHTRLSSSDNCGGVCGAAAKDSAELHIFKCSVGLFVVGVADANTLIGVSPRYVALIRRSYQKFVLLNNQHSFVSAHYLSYLRLELLDGLQTRLQTLQMVNEHGLDAFVAGHVHCAQIVGDGADRGADQIESGSTDQMRAGQLFDRVRLLEQLLGYLAEIVDEANDGVALERIVYLVYVDCAFVE